MPRRDRRRAGLQVECDECHKWFESKVLTKKLAERCPHVMCEPCIAALPVDERKLFCICQQPDRHGDQFVECQECKEW